MNDLLRHGDEVNGRLVRSVIARFYLSLAHRGYELTREGEALIVVPGRGLTPAEHEVIQRHKRQLLEIVDLEREHEWEIA